MDHFRAPFEIVVITDPAQVRREVVRRRARDGGPRLLVACWKNFVAAGPYHQPGASVCFACAGHWLVQNWYPFQRAPDPPGRAEAEELAGLLEAAVEATKSL